MHFFQKDLPFPQEMTNSMRKVLVADDEFLIRWSLAQALSREGYEVVTVENGKKAIDAACAQNFDFVITDLAMPEVDGWKVLEALTHRKTPPRVIVMTADAQENDQKIVKERGGWACVEKSCLIDGIKQALEAGSAK